MCRQLACFAAETNRPWHLVLLCFAAQTNLLVKASLLYAFQHKLAPLGASLPTFQLRQLLPPSAPCGDVLCSTNEAFGLLDAFQHKLAPLGASLPTFQLRQLLPLYAPCGDVLCSTN
jgi:hypothetical protein